MSVVAFPVQEQADDLVLSAVQERQRVLEQRENAIAEMVYISRCQFIGGLCLPWGLLTEGQRQGYRMEVRKLIQGD